MNQTHQAVILVVDDEGANLGVLFEELRDAGFKAMIAERGSSAMQRVYKRAPDLILLDVHLPDIDGFALCRRLKQVPHIRDVPIIFMTAATETAARLKGFDAGGVDYIVKPFHAREVLARVRAHLTIRRLQQELQDENARFRTLEDATFEGIILHNAGRILDVNQRLEEIFEYTRDDLIGQSPLCVVAPASHAIVHARMQADDPASYQIEGVNRHGAHLPVEIQTRRMAYQGGTLHVSAMRDLRWRKRLEAKTAQLERENVTLKAGMQERYRFGSLIGKSPAMQAVYEQILNAAASDFTVFLQGESGTGKELTARMLHQVSARKDAPFVAVNCGAIQENLFEREFFGHQRGAFTGADQAKRGYFEAARHGTLFLDEIAELKPAQQVKLLRVLRDNEYTPLGATTPDVADVRIIAATNRDVHQLRRKGHIREDFFYRIYVLSITLPPLRERKDDLPLLVEHFLRQYGVDPIQEPLPDLVMAALYAYAWPGNVRELENELQRYLASGTLELAGKGTAAPTPLSSLNLPQALAEVEKRHIQDAFTLTRGHRTQMAKLLGISRRTLYQKIKDYGLDYEHDA